MAKKLFFTFMVFMYAMVICAKSVDNAYRIDSCHYEAFISKDNRWKVTETLFVTFDEDRHGIYRYIPRAFKRSHGANGVEEVYSYLTQVDSISVYGHEYSVESNDDDAENVIIRIGSENALIKGKVKYEISYILSYPDDRYQRDDELVHNLLGTDVNTQIGTFTYNLKFEKELPSGFSLNIYSGERGSQENSLCVTPKITKNSISGAVYHIAPFNGFTIAGKLPKDYWEEPMCTRGFLAYVMFVVMATLFVITMIQFILHRRERPIVSFEYSAPDGISSAEAGVIIDNTADLKDLTSLIVWFASKGYLKIREIPGEKHTFKKDEYDMELTKLKDLPEDAPKYQKLFFDIFFKERDSIVLSKMENSHEQIAKAQLELSKHFRGDRKLSGIHWLSLISAVAFLIVGVITFGVSSIITQPYGNLIGFGVLWALPIFIVAMLRLIFSNYDMITTKTKRLIQYTIIIALGLICVGVFYAFFYNAPDMIYPIEVYVCMIASGWIIALFAGRIARDTEYRKQMMSRLLGFREFIDKSEMPMLKAQVDENPAYFFDVLPYAMIFGLTKKWQKKFKEIDVQNPDWYEASDSTNLLAGVLIADRLNHNINNSMKQIATPVSSHTDGSVGGGSGVSFVGGGGGGGGVGSW